MDDKSDMSNFRSYYSRDTFATVTTIAISDEPLPSARATGLAGARRRDGRAGIVALRDARPAIISGRINRRERRIAAAPRRCGPHEALVIFSFEVRLSLRGIGRGRG